MDGNTFNSRAHWSPSCLIAYYVLLIFTTNNFTNQLPCANSHASPSQTIHASTANTDVLNVFNLKSKQAAGTHVLEYKWFDFSATLGLFHIWHLLTAGCQSSSNYSHSIYDIKSSLIMTYHPATVGGSFPNLIQEDIILIWEHYLLISRSDFVILSLKTGNLCLRISALLLDFLCINAVNQ